MLNDTFFIYMMMKVPKYMSPLTICKLLQNDKLCDT